MRDEPTVFAEPEVAPAPATSPEIPASPEGRLSRRSLALVTAAFVAALGTMIAVKGVFLSPDRFVLVLLVPAIAVGAGRRYLYDWVPFTALIMVFEEARGLANSLNVEVLHRGPFYAPMIDGDKAIFGVVPTTWLQQQLWSGHLRFNDQVLALLDRAHFIVPPTLLFLIWLERRDLFLRCATALLVVSFAAVVGFFLFPAAPPWLAAHHGLIDPVARIGSLQASDSPVSSATSWLQAHLARNEVAAMPSLHAAYSLLSFVFAYAWRRRVGLALAWYPLAMWFAVVYLGDHYVVDLVAGVVFAAASWLVSGRLLRPGARLARLLGSAPAPLSTAARNPGGPR
jgi:membrane-associated phospholipid phosphatase